MFHVKPDVSRETEGRRTNGCGGPPGVPGAMGQDGAHAQPRDDTCRRAAAGHRAADTAGRSGRRRLRADRRRRRETRPARRLLVVAGPRDRPGHDRHVRPRHGAEAALLQRRLVLRRRRPVHPRLLLRHPPPLPGPGVRRRAGPVLRPVAGGHAVPGVPGADRRLHGGGLLVHPRLRFTRRAGADLLADQRRDADGLRRRDRGLRRAHPPAPPLGRPARRPGSRDGADGDHQLGPAGRRPDRRRALPVVPGAAARLRCPPRTGHRRQALPGPDPRSPLPALLAGRASGGPSVPRLPEPRGPGWWSTGR
ncbi:hypothetical protein M2168_003168 [Streptomyces sp. CZ24]|nr:hypothetical protein [Streptomyces sp. CZ24]